MSMLKESPQLPNDGKVESVRFLSLNGALRDLSRSISPAYKQLSCNDNFTVDSNPLQSFNNSK